jgi:hypothetical protein
VKSPNVAHQRPGASDAKHETEARSPGSLHLVCSASLGTLSSHPFTGFCFKNQLPIIKPQNLVSGDKTNSQEIGIARCFDSFDQNAFFNLPCPGVGYANFALPSNKPAIG